MLEIYLPTLFVNHFANSVQAIFGATILLLTICHGARGLPARTVRAFPEHFRTGRWWALRDTYFNVPNDAMSTPISSSQSHLETRKRGLTKAATG
jgi:hypothetical protein